MVPSVGGTAGTPAVGCKVFTASDLANNFKGIVTTSNKILNLISDGLDSNGCDLVVA